MRNFLRVVGLVGLLMILPAAHAADVSGTWKGTFDFSGSSIPLTFHFSTANGAMTGNIEGLPTGPVEIHEGKVDGGMVTFWVNSDYQGTTYKLLFKGTVSAAGDQIAFTFGTEDGSWSTQVTAAKSLDTTSPEATPPTAAADVTGIWKGSFDFQGTSVPLILHLMSANGVVSGTVQGLPTTPAEINDGKLDSGTVTFWLNTDFQGETYKLVFKGKVSAGQIAFTLGTDDGSWGSSLNVTKGVQAQ